MFIDDGVIKTMNLEDDDPESPFAEPTVAGIP